MYRVLGLRQPLLTARKTLAIMLSRLFAVVVIAAVGWSLLVPLVPIIREGLAAIAVLGIVCLCFGLVLRPFFRFFDY
jgi:hypothetical protein